MVINILQLTMSLTSQESSWCNFCLMMEAKNGNTHVIISKTLVDQSWECTTLMNQSDLLLTLVSNMHFWKTIHWSYQPRTLFWRSMMEDLKIFLKKSIRNNILISSKPRRLITSIVLLMTWSLKLLREVVDLFGLAKTMMEMSKVTLLHKDMDL